MRIDRTASKQDRLVRGFAFGVGPGWAGGAGEESEEFEGEGEGEVGHSSFRPIRNQFQTLTSAQHPSVRFRFLRLLS